MKNVYFSGFNSLRFFAAFLVLISHAYLTINNANLGGIPAYSVLHKGPEAVEFFFTLSGFLITYLLLAELKNTGTISIGQFYWRRVLRIWPLYFMLVFIGFFLLGWVYPKIYHTNYFDFPKLSTGVFLYLFFLPNIASSLFKVGLLYPLWSIGVEEQFYLIWAPFFKILKSKVLIVILGVALISSLISFLGDYWFYIGRSSLSSLLNTFKFHCMSMGAFFAYLAFYRNIYRMPLFNNIPFQYLIVSLALMTVFTDITVDFGTLGELLRSIIYSMLLIVVSGVNTAVKLENRLLNYLGKISYGIYMYHLLIDYCLRTVLSKPCASAGFLGFIAYVLILLIITIMVAATSYRLIERPIIQTRFSLAGRAGVTSVDA